MTPTRPSDPATAAGRRWRSDLIDGSRDPNWDAQVTREILAIESQAAATPKGPAVIVVFGNGTTSIGHKFAVWWDDQFGTRAVSAFGEEFEKFVEETEDMEIPAEDDPEGWEK